MFTTGILGISALLFTTMLVLLELGRRRGLRQGTLREAVRGIAVVEGAIFSLLGLLLAFTFNSAMTRWDTRRDLVVDESNAIGTAYLRLDVLEPGARDDLRARFRRYVEARIAVYAVLRREHRPTAELARADSLQAGIWDTAVQACRGDSAYKALLLLPALNDMIDLTTTRTIAASTHTPAIIYVLIILLSLAGAWSAGQAMADARGPSWFHMLGFALLTTAAFYVTLELEFPREGLIRLDAVDRALEELLEDMR